jgi:hypothetical protein
LKKKKIVKGEIDKNEIEGKTKDETNTWKV